MALSPKGTSALRRVPHAIQRMAVASAPDVVMGAQPGLSQEKREQHAGILDLQEMYEDFKKLAGGNEAKAAIAEVVLRTANEVQLLAQHYAPKKTGKLARSIRVAVFRDGLEAEIAPDRDYAAYQEYGTASRGERGGLPYVIEVKRGRALSFGGRYYKKVIHPGIPSRPYMRPALLQASAVFEQAIADQMVDLIVNTPAAKRAASHAQQAKLAQAYAPGLSP